MLEEGEIDEDDLELVPPQIPPSSSTLAQNGSINVDLNSKSISPNYPQQSPSSNSESSLKAHKKRKHKNENKSAKRKKLKHQNLEIDEMSNDSVKSDKDERFFSSWSSPVSKQQQQQQQQQYQHQPQPQVQAQQPKPVSLFDLFKNQSTQDSKTSSLYSNPVITEKENSKPKPPPLLSLPPRKTLLSEPDESELTISVESIEKKMEKKRKYAEIQKEKQKKEAEKQLAQQQKREQIVCNFFLSGRCQKGDKCQFSHQPPKKFELCKFYSNGYCSKLDKCFFMHSEFPCKFYHRPGGQCMNADKCRFSHEPITSPQLKEAFEKYLNETEPTKPALLSTPTELAPIPSLMNIPIQKDVDERPGLLPKPDLVEETGDVDLRLVLNPVASTKPDFETVKKELIVKIMKAISDNDIGIFSQIPKQTLTELMVKLINTDNKETDSLTTDALLTLLNTLNSHSSSNLDSFEDTNKLNESTNDLHIDLENTNNKFHIIEDEEPLEEEEEEEEIEHEEEVYNEKHDDEIDDYSNYDEENLIIQGNIGDFEYKLYEFDIEPSTLWSRPPVDLNLSLDSTDQESDPRIKYYSNKANCNIISNYHMKIKEENELKNYTPTSPSQPSLSLNNATASSPVYSEPVKQQTVLSQKPARIDPRLAARQSANLSPPRTQSPDLSKQLYNSLYDVQAPKSIFNEIGSNLNSSTGNKLSIEDYKRKLQKPGQQKQSPQSNTTSNNNSFLPISSSSNQIEHSSSLLPTIPSYTANLPTPQSLHELLRNFQS